MPVNLKDTGIVWRLQALKIWSLNHHFYVEIATVEENLGGFSANKKRVLPKLPTPTK
jgi:hypothetical protein